MVISGVWLGSNHGMQPLPFVIAGIATGTRHHRLRMVYAGAHSEGRARIRKCAGL